MTPMFAALALFLAAEGPPAAESPQPVYGVWQSPSLGANIEITPCEGGAICGKLLSAKPLKNNPELLDLHNKDPAKRQLTMIGQTVLEGFKGGPHKWTGGSVYNPVDGRHYSGTMSLVDNNHLKLKGCALRFLCKSQTLTRVEQAVLPTIYDFRPGLSVGKSGNPSFSLSFRSD
ncbi:MAG TPA: DUF2147 domain-containing protein [Caulobacteraceae bacterium]|jgi:uncharacterized protein (DUF2147 family)|nr:DUF2147 domain-containing protein [Caulobacteraceae bacterium]